MPTLRYRNAPAAIDWLCQVFGFERHAVYASAKRNHRPRRIDTGQRHDHARFRQGRCVWARLQTAARVEAWRHAAPTLWCPDADAAHARAVAAGATIVRPLQDTPYGSREFSVKDPEGHSWSVGTYDPWEAQK